MNSTNGCPSQPQWALIARLHHFMWLLIATKVIWSLYVLGMRSTLNRFGWWKHCNHQILYQLVQIFAKLRWNIILSSKHQRSKCVPHIFRVGHQKSFQMDNGLNIRTSLDKHRYHTLCLETTQRFQIRDNDHPPKTYRFCQRQLGTYRYCWKRCRKWKWSWRWRWRMILT